ncbi:MAG: hypothetical protein GIW99_02580 [Candidatus Eremiobacteraeota bacterium]|nr:hypothetical protein [Candidatus Eremiobacteraeota bacterium]MBC5826560.1 hypothetical protein [Candidatus Eremiobacteraeota bacterium]
MNYVELLRARKVLTVYGAVLAAVALIAMLSSHGQTPHMDINGHQTTSIPISVLILVAGYCAAIIASMLGTSLNRENGGHLELAWTKPISRSRYAAGIALVDILAIIIAMAAALLAIVAVLATFGLATFISADGALAATLLGFGVALSWYAVSQAASASLRSKGRAVSGFAWPVAFALIALSFAPLQTMLHEVVLALNFLNPLAYLSTVAVTTNDHGTSAASGGVLPLTLSARIIGVYLLAAVGLIAALAQWRRLEA